MPGRLPAALAACVACVALVAACGDDSKTTTTSSTAATTTSSVVKGSGDLPEVNGAFGTKPTVTPTTKAAPTTLVAKALSDGTGRTVAKGDEMIVNYLGMVWGSGKVFDNSFDRGQAFPVKIGAGQVIPGWDEGLVGQKVGSRVLLSIPPDKGYGSSGQPDAGISGTDTLVFVVDIVNSFGADASADGTPQPANPALPAVTATPGQKPAITIPSTPPPTTLTIQALLQGSGDTVKQGQTIVVQYVGWIWDGAKQFDSSWDRKSVASFSIGTGQVIKGWDQGLVGQRIGTRVLLVVPPDQGYGSAGVPKAGIKGTDTLVFVVDVLAAI